MLLLGDFEERFLGSLSELPLAEAAPLPASALTQAQAQVQQGLAAVDEEDKSQVSCNAKQLNRALSVSARSCRHGQDITPVCLTLVPCHHRLHDSCQFLGMLLHKLCTTPAASLRASLLTSAQSCAPCRHTARGWAFTRAP